MLKNLSAKPNYPEIEKSILKYWEDNNIQSKVDNKNKGKEEKVVKDGPITANNLPHYGHVITWTMKDVMPRFWTMNGYYVQRNMGWDCQGIPVEYEVEKKLGFNSKEDIEEYGIAKFNEKCRESVLKYRTSMEEYEKRIGRWIDHNDEYETMDSRYIESIWWSIKELHEKGLLYEGHKVVAYSTRAGTSLSNAEVALGGYKEVIDTAVTVKFELLSGPFEGHQILAWTTTPWTLPGNLMLAVNKDIEYVSVQSNNGRYIIAKNLLMQVFEDDYKVLSEFKGVELLDSRYKPLFNYYESRREQGAFKVIHADHVTTENGTGVVHLAPYGADDFDIFMKMDIKLFDYLDDTATFTQDIPQYQGMFYKKANRFIIEDLEKQNSLFSQQQYKHQMPMCWRTNTPLIYKPIKSWYLAVVKIKDQLVAENQKVKWLPEHAKNGRFGSWLENARDWALSRNRYWGTPIPIWKNDKTGETIIVGSFKELEKLSGQEIGDNFDPHRPYVDNITWKSKEDGGTFRRIVDVLDVWYDSGSMPFAQYHYPFNNKELFEKKYPAEYISESVDQTRGWFYSLMVINVALFGKTPYKTVAMSGMLGDEDGKKLSKSKGNYEPMDVVLEKYGSELLRYYLLQSVTVRGETGRFSNKFLEEAKKDFFTTLWNSYNYFVTYAKAHSFEYDQDNLVLDNVLDKWIMERLKEFEYKISKYFEEFEVMYATRELSPFINDLSTWYIRRSRERISSGDTTALTVLFYCLNKFSICAAPIIPLLTEEIYQNISKVNKNALESVHLENYPKPTDTIDTDLLKDMQILREIASIGNSLRKQHNLPVRQPLSNLTIYGLNYDLDEYLKEVLLSELNVKKVSIEPDDTRLNNYVYEKESDLTIGLNLEITPELELEGKYRKLVRELQSLRRKKDLVVTDWVNFEVPVEYKEVVEKFEEDLKRKVQAKEITLKDVFAIKD